MARSGVLTGKKRSMEYQMAFQADYEDLLVHYHQLCTYEFSEFVKFWQERHFSNIFCGDFNSYELDSYVQLALHCAKKYVIFPSSKFLCVGGLYLLYGLYSIQPIKNFSKIRLVADEIAIFRDLVDFLRVNQLLDALYAMRMLCESNAFDFVAGQLPIELNTPLNRSDVTLANNTFPHRNYAELANMFVGETSKVSHAVDKLERDFQRMFARFKDKHPHLPFIDDATTHLPKELKTAVDDFRRMQEDLANVSRQDGGERREKKVSYRRRLINEAYATETISNFIRQRVRHLK